MYKLYIHIHLTTDSQILITLERSFEDISGKRNTACGCQGLAVAAFSRKILSLKKGIISCKNKLRIISVVCKYSPFYSENLRVSTIYVQ